MLVGSGSREDGDAVGRLGLPAGHDGVISSGPLRPRSGGRFLRPTVCRLIALTLMVMVAVCDCGGPETAMTTAPTDPGTHAGASTPTAGPTATGPPSVTPTAPIKVLVVVEENKSASTALEQMPYLAALAHQYLRTSNYRAVTHPSLPNYLAIAAGSTFGVSDDGPPERHPITQGSVFDEALTAGRTVRTYAEAMPEF